MQNMDEFTKMIARKVRAGQNERTAIKELTEIINRHKGGNVYNLAYELQYLGYASEKHAHTFAEAFLTQD